MRKEPWPLDERQLAMVLPTSCDTSTPYVDVLPERACVRACVRARACVCVCACVSLCTVYEEELPFITGSLPISGTSKVWLVPMYPADIPGSAPLANETTIDKMQKYNIWKQK